jgi:hypothetical protein
MIGAALIWWSVHVRDRSGWGLPGFVSNLTNQAIQTSPIWTSSNSHPNDVDDAVSRIERLGQVPEGANALDWQLAQKASWWGKPINPREFWKDRVIWLDQSSENAAARRGRRFPPMPYEDSALSRHSNKDILLPSGGVEMPNINFHATSREIAFWDKFMKTQPKPPEVIQVKLREVTRRLFGARDLRELSQSDMERLQSSIKRDAFDLNYPREALTDEALFWCYVLEQRREYQSLLAAGWEMNSIPIRN